MLKINEQIDHLIAEETKNLRLQKYEQLEFFAGQSEHKTFELGPNKAKQLLLRRLEEFLRTYTRGNDLGLQLRGKQLAMGLHFLQINRENYYDVVVGNPPYQGTGKMREKKYIEKTYAEGKGDLYTVFMMRGLELCRTSGINSMITIRGWMFISTFTKFREFIFGTKRLRLIADLHFGAFSAIKDVSVTMAITQELPPETEILKAVRPVQSEIVVRDILQPDRNKAGLQVPHAIFTPNVQKLKGIEGWPMVYWWDEEFLARYLEVPTLSQVSPAKFGLTTGDNNQYVRFVWEVARGDKNWVPFVNGAKGKAWIEPSTLCLFWGNMALRLKVFSTISTGCNLRNTEYYFMQGISFSMIGSAFTARLHRFQSVFGNKGSSVFTDDIPQTLCLMNSSLARKILESLNPGIGFEVGDVNRLPLFPIQGSRQIYTQLEKAFTEHESHRESSVEFRQPGPSCWNYAQDWAQKVVDSTENTSLPEYNPTYDPEPHNDHISYALGVALGRFNPNGNGIIDPTKDDLAHALPHGIMFLNGTLSESDTSDSLGDSTCIPLVEAWKIHGKHVKGKNADNLRSYLRERFFKDVHLDMYEKRPIHWPMSSRDRTFVAWVNIHRMSKHTLRDLRAFYLEPAKETLKAKAKSLHESLATTDKSQKREIEQNYDLTQKQLAELNDFIADVRQCGEKGAPSANDNSTSREQDAVYSPNLDDGVMINSAALWLLLLPQWKDPKKWWKELSEAKGKKDYDWAHLAKKYWPTRIDAKCQKDPSLAVVHGCFWRYHPTRAWTWELRLQEEIGPDFTIDEADSETCRNDYLANNTTEAIETLKKEVLRREKKTPGQKEIVLNRSGLWTITPEDMLTAEKELADKLLADRKKLAKKEKSTQPITNTNFYIKALDREKAITDLFTAKPKLKTQYANRSATTPDLDFSAKKD